MSIMPRTDLLCWFCKLDCSANKDFSCDRCRKCFHSDCHLSQHRNSRQGELLNDIFPIIHGPVPADYLCPLCKFLAYSNDIVYDKKFLQDMNRAMIHIVKHLKKMDENLLFWSPVDLPGYESYVLSPKCLSEILRAAETESYHSVAAFEADIRLIFHNSNIFNGRADKAQITMEAKNLMEEGVKHCAKIRYCSKCYWLNLEYDNLNLKGDFLKPCDRPHGVVWTKNNHGELSLAKIIGFNVEKRVNKIVEVCFFETRELKTTKMEDCWNYCGVDAFQEFCKRQNPPLKCSISKKVEQEVLKYFENAKTIYKNDAPRFKQRQDNKQVTRLDEKHLYLTEFVTEWDFTNDTSDKEDRKNRLNRPESFTQFFNEAKPIKEQKVEIVGRKTPKPESSHSKINRLDPTTAKNGPTSKPEKAPKLDIYSTKPSSSGKPQRSSVANKDDHSPSTSQSPVLNKPLPSDFREVHNVLLRKRKIYSTRIEAFDKTRKEFSNEDGLYVPPENPSADNEGSSGLQHDEDPGGRHYNGYVRNETILAMKQPLIDEVNEMISNKEKLLEILEKYPESQSSSSINTWRNAIKTLSDVSLFGARSLIKEVVHKEKIPDLWKKCLFYQNIRNYDPQDRRDICDNCYDPAQLYRPIDNEYKTFCQQKCAKAYLEKRSAEDKEQK